MYEAIKSNDTVAIQEILMNALETVKFGRDNFGCPESSSDVEPPSLYIRAILDLGYLTYKEFAFLLWKLEDIGANYTDSLEELKTLRKNGSIELPEEANKYADCKPIMILIRWGFLAEDETDTSGGKHIIINPDVLAKYRIRLRNLKIYNIDKDVIDESNTDFQSSSDSLKNIKTNAPRISTGCNILLYGVPGSGKSWTIEHEYCKESTNVERLVFHPDYTNSDFIGQILPVVSKDKLVTYEFVPGPFTNILKSAYENPTEEYMLIIEEINRGNAPAIFGDIFQLLDRSAFEKIEGGEVYPPGTSEYGITNSNIAEVVYGDVSHKVRIPSNLSIFGTMNTSDQNVFPLDTAFQRRWRMRLIENNFDKVQNSLRAAKILDTDVTWQKFCEVVNKIIVSNKSNIASAEDKRLGVYFVQENDLGFDNKAIHNKDYESLSEEYDSLIKKETEKIISSDEKTRLQEIRQALLTNRVFPEKVIKYLWDDAFKFNLDALFDVEHMDSLESVVKAFIFAEGKDRFKIFKQSVVDLLYPIDNK